MRYFDASAFAKRYVIEEHSAEVNTLLASPAATSRITAVEVASVIIRRSREGSFSRDDRDRARRALEVDLAELLIVEVSREVTALAVELLARHRLRASDAIHLASCLTLCSELGADIHLVAFDARLKAVAVQEDVQVEP